MLTHGQFSTSEVQKLRNQLLDVGNKRKDGKFVAEDGTVPPGEAEISELYERCVQWSGIVLERYGLGHHNLHFVHVTWRLTASLQKRKCT